MSMPKQLNGLFGEPTVTYKKVDPTTLQVFSPSCGVKKDLFREYNFEDHVWSKPEKLLTEELHKTFENLFPSLLAFARNCVIVRGKYWIKGVGGVWQEKETKVLAEKDTINLFSNECFGSYPYDELFCKIFFDGELKVESVDPETGKPRMVTYTVGSCPQLDGTLCIPFGPDLILVDGLRYLNVWRDAHVKGDAQYAQLGREFLWLFYRSLCNGSKLSDNVQEEQEMVEQSILRGDYLGNKDFKFLINYIAAIYQKPGINLLVNLWLLGKLEGVGKGTLIRILSRCIGGRLTGRLEQAEVERGWEDHLMNKTLIEVNELELSTSQASGGKTKKWWAQWIKKKTIEEIVTFTERGKRAHEVINVANYIFTTNDESPIDLGPTDRRNQFIKTTDNPEWVHRAAALNEVVMNNNTDACAKGFAFYLERVVVDYAFINSSFINSMKAQVIQDSGNVVDEWLDNDATLDLTMQRTINTLYTDYFLPWAKSYSPMQAGMSLKSFSAALKNSSRYDIQAKKKEVGIVVTILKKTALVNTTLREEMIKEMSMRHGKDPVENKDCVVEGTGIDRTKLTSMEKLRAAVRKKYYDDADYIDKLAEKFDRS